MTSKRKRISLKEKLDIIQAVDRGTKQSAVADTFGLSKQTVNMIMKNKEAVLGKQVTGDLQPKKFRLREATFPEVEDALLIWLRDALEARVIKNCFQKAGFVFNESEEPVPLVDNPDEPEPGFWEAVEKAFGSEDFSDYVNIDADVVSTEQLTDEEIVAQVRGLSTCDQEEGEEGDEEAVTRKVTTAEALDHINALKCFFEQNGAPEEVLRAPEGMISSRLHRSLDPIPTGVGQRRPRAPCSLPASPRQHRKQRSALRHPFTSFSCLPFNSVEKGDGM
ncbi:hypothetical protein HPB47_005545 [Ixodes persulcatus]|uniref:Uncharacterized protein n=1 Tax=Ixodes persulcatus TaxID=34615 RepID=A0AC60PCM3_IXOPE|nr:hypothetical protein HPB47_005545 [Ixodes persulcatus]